MNTNVEGDARARLFNNFLDLIRICDSFDQLGKLAVILDQIYTPSDLEHKSFFLEIEATARHLRHNTYIGGNEVSK